MIALKELGLGYIKHTEKIFKMISYGGNAITVRAHNEENLKVLIDHYESTYDQSTGEMLYKKDYVKDLPYTSNGNLAILYSSQVVRIDTQSLEADIVFDYHEFRENVISQYFTANDFTYMKSLAAVNKFKL